MISQHIPVMMKEAIETLNVRDNLDYIDVTFGGGGYSEEILKKANCNLISIDKDPTVNNYAKKNVPKNILIFLSLEHDCPVTVLIVTDRNMILPSLL